MDSNQNQFEEILPLVNGMLDGTISSEQMNRLEAALDSDAGLQRDIFAYCQVHANLFSDIRSKQVVDSFVQKALPPRPTPQSQSMDAIGAALISATDANLHTKTILAESISESSPGSSTQRQWASQYANAWRAVSFFIIGVLVTLAAVRISTRSNEGKVPVVPVAYLTTSTGCDWGSDLSHLRNLGAGVALGDEITLQEGIAEFRMANGAYVSVEGPADFVLTSADALALKYGKVTAQVPWPMKKFTVTAGRCQLTTSDAEFGVSLVGGRTDVHVFVGEVLATNTTGADQVAAPSDDAPANLSAQAGVAFSQASVSEGKAMTLTSRGGVIKLARWGKANPAYFATKLNMAGPLPISKEYIDAVLASGPKDYWRFESVKDRAVSSEVTGGSDLSIAGDVRLTELSGNCVAELPPGGDCYLISRRTMDELAKTDYSFELWVKPSHVHYGTILALCPNKPATTVSNGFQLEVQSSTSQPGRSNFGIPDSIRFLHRDPPAQSAQLGTNCFSKDPYSVRRWQHVVAVKHGAQMELYVDGELQAEATDNSTLSPGQRFVIGRQTPFVDGSIQFIGQLDEVAVYARALTPKEIEAHYKLIQWSRTRKPLT